MLDAFDSIRIINLPERRDRRTQMLRELAKIGLADDPRVTFFDAIRPEGPDKFPSIGVRGVYESHCALLAEAAERGQSVLILEDDCDFAVEIRDYVVPAEYEIFYGGYWAKDPDDLGGSDIIGAHMMGFRPDTARQVLTYLRRLEEDGPHLSIDGAYVWFRRAHPEVRTVFAKPKLGHQRPSRSDISPGPFYNRMPVLRDLIELARQAKRAVRRGSTPGQGKLEW